MTLTKHILHALVAAIRKELTIQKPELSAAQRIYISSRKPANKGDAAKGFMLLVIVPVMFCVLAILVL